jgi:hypothetical protein
MLRCKERLIREMEKQASVFGIDFFEPVCDEPRCTH